MKLQRLTPMLMLVCACLHPVRVAREPRPEEPTLNVVTWNVNYGLAGSPDALQAMDDATRDADLVLLQEANAAWEAQLKARISKRFPYQHWLDDQAAGGQAVLSRRPFIVREVIDAPSGWFPALRIEAETRIGTVQVLSVHLHPPISDDGSVVRGYLGTGPTRRRELETFTAALVKGLPTIIVGDFNEGTSGDAIGWATRQKFRSALPEFQPKADTWHWPVTKSLELRAQFDHVLYSPGLEPLNAAVLPIGRSDHFPVMVKLIAIFEYTPRPTPYGTSLGLTSRGSR
ncbi:MAG: endonuclease/exonuclease/phosphatase family protein [Archangium sp.]